MEGNNGFHPGATDDRSPGQLVHDDDHRWPGFSDGVRRIYLPPHLEGRNRRLFLRQLLLAEGRTLDPAGEEARRLLYDRAGGDVICDQCGEKYADHPNDPDPRDSHLVILCDRRRVKL